MARQGGRVQLEQSDMRLALTMAKISQGRFSRAAIEETQQLMKKPRAEVQEEKKRGVEIPGHQRVNAAMERHLPMVYKNHMAGCLPCHYCTAKNLQTGWRRKETTAPPTDLAAPLPGRPSPPGTPSAAPGDAEGNESYELEGMISSCVYMLSPLPNTQFFNHNVFANNSKHDKDFCPNLLSTLSASWKYHWHWFWRWQQPFGGIWKCGQELIERNGWDTFMYISKDIFICTLKEHCRDN